MRFAALLFLLLAACASARRGWDAGWSERAAKDRIMLVRQSPETLGHRRLVYQSAAHPDLGNFLENKGLPDFIAETSSGDRQYLILYYLDTRHAFRGSTRRSPGTQIEFAGPYPMTERETKLLRDLQRSSRGEG